MNGAKSQDWVHRIQSTNQSSTELMSGAKSQRVSAPEINQQACQSNIVILTADSLSSRLYLY